MSLLFINHLYEFIPMLYDLKGARDEYLAQFIRICLKNFYRITVLPEGEEAEKALTYLLKLIFSKY